MHEEARVYQRRWKLLHDDPESLLVIYLHGGAVTLGSGWRPPSYRAMHARAPERIHTVAIDYRGFGTSTGQPSESRLHEGVLAVVRCATYTARIPTGAPCGVRCSSRLSANI
jgi:abhydrolase domain-containing protein 12